MATKIEIVRVDGVVQFQPALLEVPANEIVFWSNLDPDERHHISLTHHPLERFTSDPADTSSEILVQGDLAYSCTIHPDRANEKGAIQVQGIA